MVEINLSAPVTIGLSPDLSFGYGSLLDVHMEGSVTSFSFEWNDIQPDNLIIFSNAQAPIFGFELGAGAIGTNAWATLNALPGYGGFTDVWMTTGVGTEMNVQFPPTTVGTPEVSTWAMMLLGFLFLGYAAFRRPRHAISA